MKQFSKLIRPAAIMLLSMTMLCGVCYTALVTGLAQLVFPKQANASIIKVSGRNCGSALMAQNFTDARYLWGRPMLPDITTYRNTSGERLLYGKSSNSSPASPEYAAIIQDRVKKLRAANPAEGDKPVPVDLVTVSGSGLDPDISLAAADYQVARIAKARGMKEADVRAAIAHCTAPRLWDFIGETTVNVLKVNLLLDGMNHA